jgi:hypothetical protein
MNSSCGKDRKDRYDTVKLLGNLLIVAAVQVVLNFVLTPIC